MNKVYKVIWSKAKNCYVVASELAKNHAKSPKSGFMSKTLVAGVLACILSCSFVVPVFARAGTSQNYDSLFIDSNYTDEFAQAVSVMKIYPTQESYVNHESLYYNQALLPQYQQAQSGVNTVLANFANSYNSTREILNACATATDGEPTTMVEASNYLNQLSALPSNFNPTDYEDLLGEIHTWANNKIGELNTIIIDDLEDPLTGEPVGSGEDYTQYVQMLSNLYSQASNTYNIAYTDYRSSILKFNNATQSLNTEAQRLGVDNQGNVDYHNVIQQYQSYVPYAGKDARATGELAVVAGSASRASGDKSVAIGVGSKATANDSFAIGTDSVATETNTVLFGHVAGQEDTFGNQYESNLKRRLVNVADGTSASDVATVGQTVQIVAGSGIAVDDSTTNAIGQKVVSIGIGNLDTGTTSGNYILGTGQITGNDSIAVGSGHQVSGSHSGAFGDPDVIEGNNSYVVGNNSLVRDADTDSAFVIGNNSRTNTSNTVILGNDNNVGGGATGSWGNFTQESGDTNSVVGQHNRIAGYSNNVIGSGNQLLGSAYSMTSDEDRPFYSEPYNNTNILGNSNEIQGDNNTVLGNSISYTGDNAVIIGNQSTGIEGAVSIGNATTQRQIKYVAAGTADTDAVNVSQLNTAIDNATVPGNLIAKGDIYKSATVSEILAEGGKPLLLQYLAENNYLELDGNGNFDYLAEYGFDGILVNDVIAYLRGYANDDVKQRMENSSFVLKSKSITIPDKKTINVSFVGMSPSEASLKYVSNQYNVYNNEVLNRPYEGNEEYYKDEYGFNTKTDYDNYKYSYLTSSNLYGGGAQGTDSIAIGVSAYSGYNSISLGMNAKGLNDSVSIGNDSVAFGNGVSVGSSAKANSKSIAIGSGATTGNYSSYSSSGSIAIGNDSFAGLQSIVIGDSAKSLLTNADSTSEQNNIVIGNNASAEYQNTVALGYSAKTSAPNSVALGYGSIANEADTVSVGYIIPASSDVGPILNSVRPGLLRNASNDTEILKRRVVNVADGTAPSNAATVNQTVEIVGDGVEYTGKNAIGQDVVKISSSVPKAGYGINIDTKTETAETTITFNDFSREIADLYDGVGIIPGDVWIENALTVCDKYSIAVDDRSSATSIQNAINSAFGVTELMNTDFSSLTDEERTNITNQINSSTYTSVTENTFKEISSSFKPGKNVAFTDKVETTTTSTEISGIDIYNSVNNIFSSANTSTSEKVNLLSELASSYNITVDLSTYDTVEAKINALQDAIVSALGVTQEEMNNVSSAAEYAALFSDKSLTVETTKETPYIEVSTKNFGVNPVLEEGQTDDNSVGQGAIGDNSMAIGINSSTSGSNSLILGNNSKIFTEDSISVGQSNIIVGEFDSTTQELSDGYNNSSFGNSNVIVGSQNNVVGNNNAVYYLDRMVSDGDEPYFADSANNNKVFGDSNYVKSDNNLVFGNNNYVGNVRTNFNNAEYSAIGLNQDVINAGGWENYRASCIQGLVENSNYTQEDAEAYVDGRYLLDCYPSLREEDLNAIRNGTFTEPVIVPSNNNIAIGSNINISKYRDDVYNAIAIGNNSVVSGKESIAIGNNAVVSGDGSIALGNDSAATEANTVSIGNADLNLKRRIVNVDVGINDTDAVNVSQLNEALANVGGGATYTAGNNISIENDVVSAVGLIKYDDETKATATLEGGTRGTKLTNLKAASLANGSKDAVIGHQLWQTNENIRGFAQDIQTNSTNIANLTTSVTNALSSVAAISTTVDTVNDVKADISLNNLSDTGRQVIATAAANAVQEYMRQNGGNGGALGNSNTNLLGGTNTLSAPLTRSFGLMANPLGSGNDDIIVTNNDDINGGSDISMEVQAALDDKANISLDNINDAGISVIRDAVANDLSLKADIDSVYTKEETDSFLNEKADITFVNDELFKKADITYIDDKLDAKANKDSVYTKQETDDFLSLKADKADLNKKADVDGSNIDINAWSQKLATGEVAPGNTGLVNGGTVYNSMIAVAQSNPVQVNDSAIFIGKQDKFDDIRMIDVSNSKGEGRVMTGVITNPENKSSAANVGYVNAVGDNIVAGMNGRFAQMNNKISEVGANAAAMSGLVPYSADGDEKWALSAAVGHYDSSTAGAVGLFYKPSNNVVVNVKGTVGSDENMLAGGVTVALDKGSVPGVTKKQMVQTINSQANEIQELKAQNKQRDAEMEQMRQQMALMMQEIQKQKSENVKK